MNISNLIIKGHQVVMTRIHIKTDFQTSPLLSAPVKVRAGGTSPHLAYFWCNLSAVFSFLMAPKRKTPVQRVRGGEGAEEVGGWVGGCLGRRVWRLRGYKAGRPQLRVL